MCASNYTKPDSTTTASTSCRLQLICNNGHIKQTKRLCGKKRTVNGLKLGKKPRWSYEPKFLIHVHGKNLNYKIPSLEHRTCCLHAWIKLCNRNYFFKKPTVNTWIAHTGCNFPGARNHLQIRSKLCTYFRDTALSNLAWVTGYLDIYFSFFFIILSKGMPVYHLETGHDLTCSSLTFIFPYHPTHLRQLRRS